MEAARDREEEHVQVQVQAILPNQLAAHLGALHDHRLPDKLRQVGFFFILIAASFIMQFDFNDAMPAFLVFIIGVWFVMLSFALPMAMAPMAVVHVHPAIMEMLHLYVFGFRVDLLF